MLKINKIQVLIRGTADSIDTNCLCDFTLEMIDSKYEKHIINFDYRDLKLVKHDVDGYIELTYELEDAIDSKTKICKINLIDRQFDGIKSLLIYKFYIKTHFAGKWYMLMNKKLPERTINSNELVPESNEFQEMSLKIDELKDIILKQFSKNK